MTVSGHTCCCVAQERQRLIDKFGPNPFSDKADLLVLLDQFRDSEARHLQARGSLFYATGGNPRYVDDDESTNRDLSNGTGPASISVDHSLNYARKAIKEITEIGRMRLEERKSSEKVESDAVQESDVSSTTASSADEDDSHSTLETYQSDNADSAAEKTLSASSATTRKEEVPSACQDCPAASSSAPTEVMAEKRINVNDVTALPLST